MATNPLRKLGELGQSVWYDNIGRTLLVEGGLKRMIDKDGVCGVTSNPTIFQKAIAKTKEYDEAIEELVAEGASTDKIYDALAGEDVAMAADILRDVYTRTDGIDGWVSIEAAPSLAYDAEGTIDEAHRLRRLVDRANVLIKVPATAEGVRAIRRLIAQGVSINVTLIFSLLRYEEVREAYIAGLEELVERREAGEDLPDPASVRSVASFFVSRVDTLVDGKIDEMIGTISGEAQKATLRDLRGTAAVANAKLAYQDFLSTFQGPRWEALASKGAKVQRPLWASTSTKDPAYSDVLYVDELIGPDTVNTMPQETLDAFRDHGTPAATLAEGVDEAHAQLEALEDAGIDMGEVTDRLEAEGVTKFADSFDELMEALEEKRRQLADHS